MFSFDSKEKLSEFFYFPLLLSSLRRARNHRLLQLALAHENFRPARPVVHVISARAHTVCMFYINQFLCISSLKSIFFVYARLVPATATYIDEKVLRKSVCFFVSSSPSYTTCYRRRSHPGAQKGRPKLSHPQPRRPSLVHDRGDFATVREAATACSQNSAPSRAQLGGGEEE